MSENTNPKTKTRTEEFKASGGDILNKIKELLHEGISAGSSSRTSRARRSWRSR